MSTDVALQISRIEEQPRVLRERFQLTGYLYFKKAVASCTCRDLLQRILQCVHPYVGLDQATGIPVLTGEPFFESDPIWDEVYPKIQSLPEFHKFFHGEDVCRLMQIVAGEEIFVYPMKMGRIATPGKVGFETPPHQDAHSHQAGPTMAGIWVALHEVAAGSGRLKLLPGSHARGVRKVFRADGVGGVQCEIFPDETVWHVSEVEAGDVIIFHSCCVHKAEPNTSASNVRISIDTRFCDYGAPVFVLNMEPHHGRRIAGCNWESIYRSWEDDSLQYYWRDYPGLFDTLA